MVAERKTTGTPPPPAARGRRLASTLGGAARAVLFAGETGRPRYTLTRWLFLRLLGGVYLIAFVSYWVQLEGLVGAEGILPAAEFLDRVRDQLGAEAYWRLPTLCWLDASDRFLHAMCAVGSVAAVLLVVGVAPLPLLVLLWAVYLSLVVVGQAFFSFQWDVLLLETGLIAWFLAPLELRPRLPRSQRPPLRAAIWLVRLLLFKLMFLSGATKLLSLDPTWWSLTALDYHYFTQPLPAWTSWYAQWLPGRIQAASVVAMFVIELGVPFLIFSPRGLRALACAALLGLQLAIAATGNYGFFNVLTAVLCVVLLDDALLLRLVPRALRAPLRAPDPAREAPPSRPRRLAAAAATLPLVAIALLSLLSLLDELQRTRPPSGLDPRVVRGLDWCERHVTGSGRRVLAWCAGLRSVNGYGLFRSMTTERPEFVLEVSDDGRDWSALAFRWKPGDPTRRPRFVAPHMPRLDWQMWFAALAPPRHGYWLERLAQRLLEGSAAVWSLLDEPDRADAPPRFLRFVYYRYEFTTPDERHRTGEWWKRTPVGRGRPLTRESLGVRR